MWTLLARRGYWIGTIVLFAAPGWAQVTQRVNVGPGGAQGNGSSLYPCISADGRFVAFESFATTLVSGDTNGDRDVFVRDRQSGTTERVSVDSRGVEGPQASGHPLLRASRR